MTTAVTGATGRAGSEIVRGVLACRNLAGRSLVQVRRSGAGGLGGWPPV